MADEEAEEVFSFSDLTELPHLASLTGVLSCIFYYLFSFYSNENEISPCFLLSYQI